MKKIKYKKRIKFLFFFIIYIDKKNKIYYNWPCKQVKNTKKARHKKQKKIYKIFKILLTRKIKNDILKISTRQGKKMNLEKKIINSKKVLTSFLNYDNI